MNNNILQVSVNELEETTARNYLCICCGQNAKSVCGLTAVKLRPLQLKAAVSARLISTAIIRGCGEDYNRLLLALFQKVAFVLERVTLMKF